MTRTIRRGLWPLLVLLLVASELAAGLHEDVDILIRTADLGGATVAVSIRDAHTGHSHVGILADRPMIPASNMKLLTTGAALHVLGPRFSFSTRLLRDGDRLIVLGDGDPAFGDPKLLAKMHVNDQDGLDVESFLDLWIQAVVDAGIRDVREVVVDGRIFDREFVHATWPRDQLNRSYCAEVAGFNFHLNVLHLYPRPVEGQRPSIANRQPHASWHELINKATSETGRDDANTIWVARKLSSNHLTVYGNARFAYRTPVPVTVHDMPEFAAHLLADRLRAAGVAVDSFRVSGDEDDPSTGETIGPVISTPIATVVSRCNTDSQNLFAEALLKRMGHAVTGRPGSWLSGGAVLRNVINERVDEPKHIANLYVADGSGLSRDNRVSAGLVTDWLNTFVADERIGDTFIESLAVGGESGTLRRRFRTADLHGARVQGKSGFINGVSCLSGYVTMSDQRRRSFSILINDLKVPTSRAKRVQEAIVELIARDMAASGVTLGGN
ncbi:MAG: D-alanyl-D-alanine carboxypeptidase/D-alanyl-D-alanine endopeptidase [Planctomycetota bacterium]|jgi:D-alanyl-D-alanine carboxypeptidase/D-alanyl-D-alanine-endopeptidase (penicillin-binding protein 4)